jgi:membrane carboxypeptidase/penicillin-binding protein
VGSKNFSASDYDGQVNVTTSLRQPGSSFKPFTYVTAFKKGFSPATLLMDVPTTFPGGVGQPDYVPVNYDEKFVGPIQVRYALANSRNVPAVKMLAMIGIKDVLETATDMGLTTLPPTAETLKRVGLSLTLGGGEVRLLDMTDAFSAFVNKGFRVDPIAILKVTDINGKVLEDNKPQKVKRVLTEEAAFLINSILSDNEARKDVFGLNSLLNVPNVMVKTGTTNDKRDNNRRERQRNGWCMGGKQ